MKKVLFMILLASTTAFAVNPKQSQVNKVILSDSKKIELVKTKLAEENIECASVWRTTYNFCMELGIRYESSVAIADFAAETCLKIKYGPATTIGG